MVAGLRWTPGSILAAVLATLVTVVVALTAWWLTLDTRQFLDIEESLLQPGSGADPFMPGARRATDELCGDGSPCLQAVTSENVDVFRYRTREEAAAAAASWGADGYHSHWIAVHFAPGRLSEWERGEFVEGFDGSNTTSPD